MYPKQLHPQIKPVTEFPVPIPKINICIQTSFITLPINNFLINTAIPSLINDIQQITSEIQILKKSIQEIQNLQHQNSNILASQTLLSPNSPSHNASHNLNLPQSAQQSPNHTFLKPPLSHKAKSSFSKSSMLTQKHKKDHPYFPADSTISSNTYHNTFHNTNHLSHLNANHKSSFTKNDFLSHAFTTIPTIHTVPLPSPHQIHIYSGSKSSVTWCYASPRSILSLAIPALNLTASMLASTLNLDSEPEVSELDEITDQNSDTLTETTTFETDLNENVSPDNQTTTTQNTSKPPYKHKTQKKSQNSKYVTCLLQYYNESKPLSWSTLKEFNIYEHQPTKLNNLNNLSNLAKYQAHKIWRLQILPNDFYNLSPFTLHSSVNIDSCFCPELASCLDLNFNIEKFSLTYENFIRTDLVDLKLDEFKIWENSKVALSVNSPPANSGPDLNLNQTKKIYKISSELAIHQIQTQIVESRGLCAIPFLKLNNLLTNFEINLNSEFFPTTAIVETEIEDTSVSCGQLAIHTLSRISKRKPVLAFTIVNRILDSNIYISQVNTTELINIPKLTSVEYYLYSTSKPAHLNIILNPEKVAQGQVLETSPDGKNSTSSTASMSYKSEAISLDLEGDIKINLENFVLNVNVKSTSKIAKTITITGMTSFLNLSDVEIFNMPKFVKNRYDIYSCLPDLDEINVFGENFVLSGDSVSESATKSNRAKFPVNINVFTVNFTSKLVVFSNKYEVINHLPNPVDIFLDQCEFLLAKSSKICVNQKNLIQQLTQGKNSVNLLEILSNPTSAPNNQNVNNLEEPTPFTENAQKLQTNFKNYQEIIVYLKVHQNSVVKNNWVNINNLHLNLAQKFLTPTIQIKLCPWMVIKNETNCLIEISYNFGESIMGLEGGGKLTSVSYFSGNFNLGLTEIVSDKNEPEIVKYQTVDLSLRKSDIGKGLT